MKKILLIIRKKDIVSGTNRQHTNWIYDCKNTYRFDFWGKDINQDLSLQSLKNKIDQFRPDYIYMTVRNRYEEWLPDLTNIKTPKIFVEMDTCYYDVNDPWYKQFDKLYCRCQVWGNWEKIPLFRWSIPEKALEINKENKDRKGIFFVGHFSRVNVDSEKYNNIDMYNFRYDMSQRFKNKINFLQMKHTKYWKILSCASALVCPAEHYFGNYVPAKLFEYSACGAAVLTNCDLRNYNMKDLDKVVIKYTNLDDLNKKLKIDFKSYYGKAREVMKNHTHKIRYRELFGK